MKAKKGKERGRRRFLKESAALAALAVGGVRSASGQARGSELPTVLPKEEVRAYGVRSRFENSARAEYKTPIQDSQGIITSSALHHHSGVGKGGAREAIPDIDPRQHRLLIHGMVDRPLIFTVEELKRLPSTSRILFIECAGNSSPSHLRNVNFAEEVTVQLMHGWGGCSEYTGVLLSVLLKEAGVQKGANWLVTEGAETGKLTQSLPLAKAMDDVLVAYSQNGEAVRPEQGYPLRLVVPGWEGIRNVKWLRRIKAVDQPNMGRIESTMYPSLRPDGKARWMQFEMPVKSLITFPSDAHQLSSHGFYEITGLAWSGRGAIRRVEVSTDGGHTWKDAQLQEPVLRFAHTRFRFPWNWNGEEAVIQARGTDERGDVQPTLLELGEIWGVDSDFWTASTITVNHFNAIQPWKVDRDGSVHNAML